MTTPCDPSIGEWMYKYSFSDSRRVKRFFRLQTYDGCLIWGSSPDDDKCLRVDLHEAVGIIYGPQTTTFARLQDAPQAPSSCQCLSILFVGRTLDLCTLEDTADIWFKAIQSIVAANGNAVATPLSYRDLLFRKAWWKLSDTARLRGQTVPQLFRSRISQMQRVTPPKSISNQITSLRKSLSNLRTFVSTAHSEFATNLSLRLTASLKQLSETRLPTVDSNEDLIRSLREELRASQAERVRLHNELLDLRGNIRVFARVRPLLPGEVDDLSITDGSPTFVFPPDSDDSVSVYIPRDVRRRTYTFDRVFRPSRDQAELFESIQPFVQSALDGYNFCVFSYGVTNSGKTYSMEGTAQYPGLNKLAIDMIFRENACTPVAVSVVQIYNETVTDLLGKPSDVRTHGSSHQSLTGVTEEIVRDSNEAQSIIKKATSLRATNSTKINNFSSRSHLVVTLKLPSGGRLHLIDLAGSENVNRSGAIGETLREAQNINKSLSALGDVVHALIELKKNPRVSQHVPYRNSKLTMLLKDSLGGNSKTVMILQVSPAQADLSESLNSLSFGQRVRAVQVGKATKVKHVSPRE